MLVSAFERVHPALLLNSTRNSKSRVRNYCTKSSCFALHRKMEGPIPMELCFLQISYGLVLVLASSSNRQKAKGTAPQQAILTEETQTLPSEICPLLVSQGTTMAEEYFKIYGTQTLRGLAHWRCHLPDSIQLPLCKTVSYFEGPLSHLIFLFLSLLSGSIVLSRNSF